MIYFSKEQLLIRNMEYGDAQTITDAEIEQGWNAWGAFGGINYPEIVDFGVLEKYRKQGIGTVLMDIAEEIAATFADIVYLGVGLHSGYGSTQRMYVKRGYIPDGSGVWYQNKIYLLKWPKIRSA